MTKPRDFFDHSDDADPMTQPVPIPADPWAAPAGPDRPSAFASELDGDNTDTTGQLGAEPPLAATTGPDVGHYDDQRLLRRKPSHTAASRGWRKWISKITVGRISPGPSAKQERAAEQVERIRAALNAVHKVAFINFKGGVGKSTSTVAVGNAIARVRGDRVIAIDSNPDMGTLSARFGEDGGPAANIEALAGIQSAERYSSVRVHTVQNGDRLEMLGAQNDPRTDYTLGPRDYSAALKVLELHYNVILIDYGTSLTSPLFQRIAEDVGGLVVVASQNVPGYRGAMTTLEWLQAHGYGRLLEHTIVALNATAPGGPLIQMDMAESEFLKYVPTVVRIPYDPHLAQGLNVDYDRLKKKTRRALMALAEAIAEHYPTRQTARHRAADAEL